MVEDPKFNNTILTNIGHQMLASIASGNRKITYTKAEAYTQDVSSISNETLQALNSLQGKELSANLLVSNDNGNVVTITANFENKSLTNDVVFNSIGWFAKLDTDDAEHGITANQEYLIGITPASGTQTLVAPPADQSSSQAISINLNMKLSDASNVNMTVSDAGAVHFNQLHDELVKYTTTADLTKLLAGKADLGLSYTKAEIDAKLLDLTTDTDGKVSADQVQALISDKANISDVYTKSQVDSALSTRDAQISDKANISDVYTRSQVDSALSTRDTEISTKANISDVYTKSDVDNALAVDRGRLGKLEGTQTLDSPDFNSITSTGVYYITNNTPANIKNNPVSQWGVLVVSNGNGNRTSQVYYPDDGSPQWCRLLNGSNWLPWYQLSTKKDISNAINKFDLSKVKFHKQYVTSDGQAGDKTWSATKNEDGTYTIDLWNDDWTASKLVGVLTQLPNKADTSTVNAQIADAKNSISSLINRVKQIDGENAIDNAVDVNTLEGTPDQVTVYKLSNAGNTNTPPWIEDHRGVMIVLNYGGNAKTQIWTPVGSGAFNEDGSFGWRYWEGGNPPDWRRLASVSYIDNLHNDLQNQINANDQGTIVTGYDWNTGTASTESRSLQNAWIVDQTALRGAVDRMNDINSNANGRLPLGGGDMNLRSTINWNGGNVNDKTGNLGGLNWAGGTDWAKIYGDQDDNDNLDLAIDLGDDGSNHVSFRKNGSETSAITSDGHFTGTVDWSNVSGRPDVTPIVSGAGGDDLFAFKSNQIRLYPGNGKNCKNLPPASNTQWFTVQYVFENPNGDGVAIFRSPANEVWTIGNNSGIYTTHWVKLANSNDISDLQNQIQQLKDNQFEVQTFTDANAAASWEAQRPGKRMAIIQS